MKDLDKVKHKKLFFFFLMVYFVGFMVLTSITDKINQDGYIITALIAPLLILSAVVFMTYSLIKK